MNAYELAYLINNGGENIDRKELSMMLCQQADRIAELEKSSMAWYEAGKFFSPQIKELTNEEIRQIAVECGAYINEDTGSLYPDDMCVGSFARAILKKAIEK